VSSCKPTLNFEIRELRKSDFRNGFFETLSNLSHVGQISQNIEEATKILESIEENKFSKIYVAVDNHRQVIGSITLLVEQKFIHNAGKVGHIEDVVTRKEYNGKGIGSALVQKCIEAAKEEKCYKVILDCSLDNVAFYEKAGFRKHEVSMRYDIDQQYMRQ
jgi:glucosamine-phosphate N-acetyltransferase